MDNSGYSTASRSGAVEWNPPEDGKGGEGGGDSGAPGSTADGPTFTYKGITYQHSKTLNDLMNGYYEEVPNVQPKEEQPAEKEAEKPTDKAEASSGSTGSGSGASSGEPYPSELSSGSESSSKTAYLLDNVISYEERILDNLNKRPPSQSEVRDAIKEFWTDNVLDATGKVQLGGKYQRVDAKRLEEDKHHIPSVSAMKAARIKLSKYTGPVVVITRRDHSQTGSWRNSYRAQEYRKMETNLIREGKFIDAVQMGIDDLRKVARDSGDEHRYDQAIHEMLEYLSTIDPKMYMP